MLSGMKESYKEGVSESTLTPCLAASESGEFGESLFFEMISEIRGYGAGLLLANQAPQREAEVVRSNIGTRIVMKQSSEAAALTFRRLMKLNDEQLHKVMNLEQRQMVMQHLATEPEIEQRRRETLAYLRHEEPEDTYDPRGTETIDPARVDLKNVPEYHWMTVTPVTTEALIQLMLGGSQIQYNGGMLHTRVRYFDPDAERPGLPPDVAALVTKVEADRTVLELVNLSPFDTRRIIVQSGMFGNTASGAPTSRRASIRTRSNPTSLYAQNPNSPETRWKSSASSSWSSCHPVLARPWKSKRRDLRTSQPMPSPGTERRFPSASAQPQPSSH